MNEINQVNYYHLICDVPSFEKVLLKVIASFPLDRRSKILPLWFGIKEEISKMERDRMYQAIGRFIKECHIKTEIDLALKDVIKSNNNFLNV